MTEKKGPTKVGAEELRRFSREVFERAGMNSAHAEKVAEVLVWANLRGVDTHGVTRIPRYVELIEVGDMNPRAAMKFRNETAGSVLIDADRAPGPVAMSEAMKLACRKARDAGIGLAVARATTHTAALGYFTRMAAAEGMIGICLSSSWPNMAYHGARVAGVSTSPISIAVPGGQAPLVLDMATGVVSMGKLIQARKAGQPIPEGWALDKAGNPTTDPNEANVPLPMAGPKGSGLSLLIECLTSILASNPLLTAYLEGEPEGQRHRQNGLAIAIDIGRFCDVAYFRAEIERLVNAIKALPPAVEGEPVLVPGERGDAVERKRSQEGVPIPPPIWKELQALAERLGVAMPAALA
jgi:LDH2 family malate/lactate/ureidoglycolate dehydrogenase